MSFDTYYNLLAIWFQDENLKDVLCVFPGRKLISPLKSYSTTGDHDLNNLIFPSLR